MAVKGEKGSQTEEFARSAWDWSGELVKDADLLTQVSVSPTARKGVWTVQVRAVAHVDGKGYRVVIQHGGEWPNSEHVDFWGYVLRLQMQLSEIVASDAAGGWLPS